MHNCGNWWRQCQGVTSASAWVLSSLWVSSPGNQEGRQGLKRGKLPKLKVREALEPMSTGWNPWLSLSWPPTQTAQGSCEGQHLPRGPAHAAGLWLLESVGEDWVGAGRYAAQVRLVAKRTNLQVSVHSGASPALHPSRSLLLPLCLMSIKQMPLVVSLDLESSRAEDSGEQYQLSEVNKNQSHIRGGFQRQVIR